MKRVKRSYLDISTFIESFGHKLLSKEDDIVEENGFVKAKTKLTISCEKDHVFETNFDCYRRGKYKCLACVHESGMCRRKYTFEDIVSLFYEEKYVVTSTKSEYKNMETVLNTVCPRGHAWSSSYNNFKAGYRCPNCKKEDIEKDERMKCESILIENGYAILDFCRLENDKFSKSFFTIECENNHVFDKTISSIKQGKLTCLYCYGKLKKTLKDVEKEFNLWGFKILAHNGYENNQSKFLISCKNNHKTYTTYARFMQKGKICSLCSENSTGHSKGEKRISIHLDKLGVNYFYQYRFDDCKLKQPLPFDFYLPDYNMLIEYDGEQHFKPVEKFGGIDFFIKTKISDTVKNEYCKSNNIELIRISYKEYNKIEDIVNFKIQGKSSTTRPRGRTP